MTTLELERRGRAGRRIGALSFVSAIAVLHLLDGCNDTGLERLLGAGEGVPCTSRGPTECSCEANGPSDFAGACDEATFGYTLCCADDGYPGSGVCVCEPWACAVGPTGACTCSLLRNGEATDAGVLLECLAAPGDVCCTGTSNGVAFCSCGRGTDCGADTLVTSCSLYDDPSAQAGLCQAQSAASGDGTTPSSAVSSCSE